MTYFLNLLATANIAKEIMVQTRPPSTDEKINLEDHIKMQHFIFFCVLCIIYTLFK